jgi:hypothetical protein
MSNHTGKVAVVTAASKGIGAAIAKSLIPTKFKAGDWVHNTDLEGTLGVFTRYVKPHGGLPMCEVRIGNVIHICREYLLLIKDGRLRDATPGV